MHSVFNSDLVAIVVSLLCSNRTWNQSNRSVTFRYLTNTNQTKSNKPKKRYVYASFICLQNIVNKVPVKESKRERVREWGRYDTLYLFMSIKKSHIKRLSLLIYLLSCLFISFFLLVIILFYFSKRNKEEAKEYV